PVLGKPNDNHLDTSASNTIVCTIPLQVEQGIGTYFNRAVVSSQAFAQRFGSAPKGQLFHEALAWLSNGMADMLVEFIAQAPSLEIVAYHLTDEEWIIP